MGGIRFTLKTVYELSRFNWPELAEAIEAAGIELGGASRTRRVGPERFEVKGLVELCALLDGRRSVGDLVEVSADRVERLRTGRMLCLLEACDLARPS